MNLWADCFCTSSCLVILKFQVLNGSCFSTATDAKLWAAFQRTSLCLLPCVLYSLLRHFNQPQAVTRLLRTGFCWPLNKYMSILITGREQILSPQWMSGQAFHTHQMWRPMTFSCTQILCILILQCSPVPCPLVRVSFQSVTEACMYPCSSKQNCFFTHWPKSWATRLQPYVS